MAYEVWMFKQRPGRASRLVAILVPPPEYSVANIYNWARAQESVHDGCTSLVRKGRCY